MMSNGKAKSTKFHSLERPSDIALLELWLKLTQCWLDADTDADGAKTSVYRSHDEARVDADYIIEQIKVIETELSKRGYDTQTLAHGVCDLVEEVYE